MIYTILFSLLFAILPVQDNSQIAFNAEQQPDAEAVLNKGLDAEAAGNYEEALQIWLDAKPSLAVPSLAVGQNYIRVVTAHDLNDYYKAASAMYLWGLSGETIAPNREALQKEINFLEPLVEKDIRKGWEQLLSEDDPALYEAIRGWWALRDPAPGTVTNERLIEHWQRIAHARSAFTRNDNSPYGTDDRGTAWAAYGKPERIFKKQINLSLAEAKRLAAKFGAGFRHERVIAMAAMEMHHEPEIEIWVYLNESPRPKENLVLMFGPKAGGGFRELEAVEELIPNRAFTRSKRYEQISISRATSSPASKVSPGMILQWAYYRYLAATDYYFGKAFTDMANEWETALDFDKYLGPLYKQKNFHETLVIRTRAAKEISTLEKDFPSIPLEVYQYGLLDTDNQPVFATFLVSRPQRAFLEDLAVNQDTMIAAGTPDSTALRSIFSAYELIHGVHLSNANGKKMASERHQAMLRVNANDMQTPSVSGFKIPYSKDLSQVFYADLHNNHPKSKPRIDTPFPKTVRGIGKLRIKQPEPLPNNRNEMQMGELILGWDIKANPEGLVPFWVAHNKKIPQGEPLALHFEIYHLQQGSEGLYGFDLNYSILPVNWLGWTQERKDALSITVSFEHDAPRFTEDLEIKSADLEPGRYVLRMNAMDSHSTNKAYREVEFEVVEKDAE